MTCVSAGVRRCASERRTRPRAGFTLVELMVVLAVLGVMAGVAGLAARSLERTDPASERAAAVAERVDHVMVLHGGQMIDLARGPGLHAAPPDLGQGRHRLRRSCAFHGLRRSSDARPVHRVSEPSMYFQTALSGWVPVQISGSS